MTKPNVRLSVVLSTLLMALSLASCYKIVWLEMDHEAITNSKIHGKMVVKRNGQSDNGLVQHVYALFGVCVPKGWTGGDDIVMTQVPKETTDVGDEEYTVVVKRKMVYNERYAKLLNAKYPKPGYTWLGYASEAPIKSLFNTKEQTNEVDSIYIEFSIMTNDKTGTFYLDYIAGQCDHDKLDVLGDNDDGWNTNTGTFSASGIGNVVEADTRITVTHPDGTIDDSEFTTHIEEAWNLVEMENGTRKGSIVKAYKDKLYDGLFTRDLGWNGGDGVFTVGLPNGDVFWTFNDSFYGIVNENRARGNCSFPRNTIMVQKSVDGHPGESADDFVWLVDYVNWKFPKQSRYFQSRTHLRHPQGEKTASQIRAGDIDQHYLYWSGDGAIVDGKLQLLWFGVYNGEDGENLMRNIGTALATYDLEGNEPKGYYLETLPDYLPKEGDYLYLSDVDHNVNTNPVSYGSTLWEDEDGHIYLYARTGNDCFSVVARTETRDLSSKWQYYVCNSSTPDTATEDDWTWQDEYPSAEQLKHSSIVKGGGWLMLPWVWKEGDWYYLLSQEAIFGKKVYLFRSKHPWGPFDERREVMTMPSELDKLGTRTFQHTYMVNIHPALSREGELVLTTNTDVSNFWDNYSAVGSADFYRPYFYRVFNWKYLYDDYEPEPSGISAPTTAKPEDRLSDAYYNLQGIRVKNPSKGIFIHKGKKVVM